MRFGNRRGVTLALVLAVSALTGSVSRADWFTHTIPKVAPAVDLNTGGEFFAPPVPYGHYAKDNPLAKHAGLIHGKLAGLGGHGLLGGHGKGCADCGGHGHGDGHGLLGKGGHGHGLGLGGHGDDCSNCGGSGLFGGHGLGKGHILKGLSGHGHGHGEAAAHAVAGPVASPQGVAPMPSAQVTDPCALPGCGRENGHGHKMSWPCGGCKGRGCGLCGGKGLMHGSTCDSCGGSGCGHCGGGAGGHGLLGKLCGGCGGAGCGLCGHLKSKLHALNPHALLGALSHRNKVRYFVGAGGPVPLTPGYVPYVVPVRSPRDYFAFPPFSQNVP